MYDCKPRNDAEEICLVAGDRGLGGRGAGIRRPDRHLAHGLELMNSRYFGIGVGISLGLSSGFSMGAAMQNVGVGVALGCAFGVAFVMVFSAHTSDAALARKKAASDKPPTHPLGL
jgi:hypothetical protein